MSPVSFRLHPRVVGGDWVCIVSPAHSPDRQHLSVCLSLPTHFKLRGCGLCFNLYTTQSPPKIALLLTVGSSPRDSNFRFTICNISTTNRQKCYAATCVFLSVCGRFVCDRVT